MLNGLDLFSGIGGLTIALEPWVRPIAYCEIDRYAQSVLLSRMSNGELPLAPIWDDIKSLRSSDLDMPIEIIYGGFPCQDISVAGHGIGLEGKRSGLFFEILRLTKELRPKFVFLENVPAIRTRGAETVAKELAAIGYDCRWETLSAKEVGALHLRNRWWLLAAHSDGLKVWDKSKRQSRRRSDSVSKQGKAELGDNGKKEFVADSMREGLEGYSRADIPREGQFKVAHESVFDRKQWASEPNVGRVVNGLPHRVDRIKALGNAVVPLQAREAFKRLSGIK